MAKVILHGKEKTKTTICPGCGCVFEFNNDEYTNGIYIKCPECEKVFYDKVNTVEKTKEYKYIRDLEAEQRAIDRCISLIDFEILATACRTLFEQLPYDDYGFLEGTTPETLKQSAIDTITRCFKGMSEYGYYMRTASGDEMLSYCVEGKYYVETFYDIKTGDVWCVCYFAIESASE